MESTNVIESFKYQLVSIDIMENMQVNIRMTDKMFNTAKEHAEKKGFGNVQEFIREILRERLFEESLTKEEISLVQKLANATEKKKMYKSEKELFAKLQQ